MFSIAKRIVAPYAAEALKDWLTPESIDPSRLKVQILSGDIELDGAELREDAFDFLGLPIEIGRSYIGHITANVPWKSAGNKPLVVHVNDVYIVLRVRHTWPKDRREKRRRQRQQWKSSRATAYLLEQENKGKKAQEGSDSEDKNKHKPSFFQRLATKVLDNLQFRIHNVHICIEDSSSFRDNSVIAGITCKDLVIQSTDASYIPKFVNPAKAGNHVYKLLQVTGLSFYSHATGTRPSPHAPSALLYRASHEQYLAWMEGAIARDKPRGGAAGRLASEGKQAFLSALTAVL